MKLITSTLSPAWVAACMAAVAAALPPGPRQAAATPTVYLAGDSTMAEQGGKNGTEGERKEWSRLQCFESCMTDFFFSLEYG